MYKLLPVLIENMGGAYPELNAQKDLIAKVIKEEEDSFLRTWRRVSACWKRPWQMPKPPARTKSAERMPLPYMTPSVSHST